MKTVRMLKIENPSITFKSQLDCLMREFCSAKRYAFNRLLEGYKVRLSSGGALTPYERVVVLSGYYAILNEYSKSMSIRIVSYRITQKN